MAWRLIGLGALCLMLTTGCCPRGVTVLERITIPAEEQTAGCRFAEPSETAIGPLSPMSSNPLVTGSRAAKEAVGSLVDIPPEDIKSIYAAVYECEAEGRQVGVYGILFYDPIDSERAAALSAHSADLVYKGQLACVILWDDGCEQCYEQVRARVDAALPR